jgi:DegV family protein with EDD domain
MMKKIAIITDSTACMPEEMVKKYKVHVIPVRIQWDDETLVDGVDIKAREFYERLEASSTIPTTSQPSAGDFMALFEKLAESHEGIIAPLISSGVSGTVNSAETALQTFKKVPVEMIDTHLASGGAGMVVEAAGKAISNGKDFKDVRKAAESVMEKVKVYFVVDTLKYLHKGGRIGGASRYLGTALNIKPILYLDDNGKIDALEKVRTKKKAATRIVELAAEHAAGRPVHVCVMHANTPAEAEGLKKQLEERMECKQMDIYDIGPGVGVHVGPGAIGLSVYPV